jgi:hypothetical protein
MILHEALETLYEKKMHADEQTHEDLQKKVETVDTQYKAVTVALQELTYKFIRERGALWESVNGLWNDYDERHKQTEPAPEQEEPEKETAQVIISDIKQPHDTVIEAETAPAAEGTETGKKRTKAKKAKENTHD